MSDKGLPDISKAIVKKTNDWHGCCFKGCAVHNTDNTSSKWS
jgi:hypothetical protein